MDTNYKYYKEITGELVRVHIEQDTTPENPRYAWDGNIGHMMCWHRNYQLGDYKENSYSDNLDFLNNLLRARILSAYDTCHGSIWIITEWDRSVTTILFPSEY